nr:discoidin domain-containing protein [Bacteroidota bacterium]
MKNKGTLYPYILLILFGCFAAANEDNGLLKNFSFEKQLKSWQKNGNASEIKVFNWHHIDGNMSCGIGNDKGPDNAYGEIFQEINVPEKINKGDLCLFKMRLKSENHYSGQASINIEFHDEKELLYSKQSKILTKQFEWQELIVSAEAPANTKKIIVKCISEKMASSKGGSFLWIDFGNVICPIINASSYKNDNHPKNLMKDGMWQSNSDDKQWIEIDFRDMIEFSGISIDWTDDYASEYDVLISEDGNDWTTIYNVQKSSNEQDKIYLNHTVTRYIKINCNKSSADNGYGIKEIEIMEKNSIITLDKYYNILAEQNPGFYPRWLIKKQAYWTGTGAEADKHEAIICEDGTIEPHKRGFSLIPFLYFDNKVITRDDVKIKQTLVNEYLPIPQVTWDYDNIQMDIKLFTHGKTDQSIAYVMYKITNTRKEKINGKLFLSIRPFQIFPPWQRGGGFTYLDKIDYADNIITLNNKFTDFFKRPPFDHTIRIYPLVKPDKFGAIASSKSFKLPIKTPTQSFAGNIMYYIQKGEAPSQKSAYDPEGLAEGAFYYNLNIEPGQSLEFFVAVPLHDKDPSVNFEMPFAKVKEEINKMLQQEINFWLSRVDRFSVDIPEMDLVKMLKSNIAFNLITKDGHAIQPGARSYDKAWIRDGGMAAAAMLKMGLTEEVRGFIDWYTTFQEDSGLIPPIIDNKADDPLWELKPPHNLIEYDCQGEYIFTVMQYYNFTKDKIFLQGKLDNIKRACEYMVFLRNQTKIDEFKNGDLDVQKYYGILPRSTSHEGYYREYSYWDDFWGLKGWKDARKMFEILGEDDLAKWAQEEYADFKKCFYDSMRKTIEFYDIDYIPASASLGDYDPTSTAVAIMYCDEIHNLPEKELKYTFDKYYNNLAKRFKPNAEYRFTPYELRSTPAFIYMDQK